jgi:hypothetical protein
MDMKINRAEAIKQYQTAKTQKSPTPKKSVPLKQGPKLPNETLGNNVDIRA